MRALFFFLHLSDPLTHLCISNHILGRPPSLSRIFTQMRGGVKGERRGEKKKRKRNKVKREMNEWKQNTNKTFQSQFSKGQMAETTHP